MEIKVTPLKRCYVVRPAGRIDSNTHHELEGELDKIMTTGIYRLVLDMSDVSFISSAGWWTLINTQKKCRPHRGQVYIVNLKKEIRESLNLVGMEDYFKIFDDMVTAVGNF